MALAAHVDDGAEPAGPAEAPPPELARRRLGPTLGGAIGALLAVVGFTVASARIADNSFLTHLATGRLILAERAVPSLDPYSYSAAGEPWVVQSWLASALYAGIEDAVGLWGVRALTGALAAAIVVGLWAITRPIPVLATRISVVALPLAVGTMMWTPRPLMFGLVGLVAVVVVLSGRLSPRWLLPVFALWVATHGSFPIGLAVISAAALGCAIDARRLPAADLRALGWAGLGTATMALGPLGVDGLLFPVRLLARQDVLGQVIEWQAPRYQTPAEWLFLALVVVATVVLGRGGAPWRRLLPAALALVLGLTALRNLPVASIVLVWALVDPAPASRRRAGASAADRNVLATGVAACALVLAAAVASALPGAPALELDGYPVDELAALEADGLLADDDVRLLTHDTVGNYLTLRHGAGARVFIDDRVDMYPASVVQDYVTLLKGGDVAQVLERWQPDLVLWRADAPLRYWLELSPDWRLLDGDDDHVTFCRRSSTRLASHCR